MEAVCSRAVIIAKGRIVADDTPEELLKKAPGHNAVIIRSSDLASVRAALSAVEGIAGIEDLDSERVSIRPKPDAEVVDAVGVALRAKGVVVDEIHVERGRLDDVFRQITATG